MLMIRIILVISIFILSTYGHVPSYERSWTVEGAVDGTTKELSSINHRLHHELDGINKKLDAMIKTFKSFEKVGQYMEILLKNEICKRYPNQDICLNTNTNK
jgi:hypothetical protein